MTRRQEAAIAAALIGAAGAFTAAVLVWHFALHDVPYRVPLPPWPSDHSAFGWFALYAWMDLLLGALAVTTCATAIVLVAAGRANALRCLLPLSGLLVASIGCFGLYLPLWGAFVTRIHRLRGTYEEPVVALRLLVAVLGVTLAEAALYALVAQSRHVRAPMRIAAFFPSAIVATTCLHVGWILMALPLFNGGEPADWQRHDLLVSFRPCRGALLWATRADGKTIPVGRIDELWARFADPRSNRDTGAVSVEGEFRHQYMWLTTREASAFRLRKDDPAVVNCDQWWRADPVKPEEWHQLGFEW